MRERVGLLVVNLGTPDAPTTTAVRRYLRQFLSDGRVIDLAAPLRWLLLNAVILPTRPAKSAEAYRKVWTPAGSPLLVNSAAFTRALAERLGPEWPVELAMRYGNPSIESGIDRLMRAGADRIVALPMYPHAASSSVGSSVEEIFRVLARRNDIPSLTVLPPFHADEGFLESWREAIAASAESLKPDHVLFSFHGLPERHVLASDSRGASCLKAPTCCDALSQANVGCYRAQCHETARQLAKRLSLDRGAWSIAFQSRLGRTPWITPHTDERLRELAHAGVRRLLVACPGFVADCLETVEEIAIRGRADFIVTGGQELALVPSLNARPTWVAAVEKLVRRASGE